MQNLKRTIMGYYRVSGRMGRLRFSLGAVAVLLVTIILIVLSIRAGLLPSRPGEKSLASLPILVFFAAGIAPLLIKRFHDLNSSGWWTLSIVLGIGYSFNNPFVGLYLGLTILILMFKRGNPEENAWGTPEIGAGAGSASNNL